MSSLFEKSPCKDTGIFFLIFKFPLLFELWAIVMNTGAVLFLGVKKYFCGKKICCYKNLFCNRDEERSIATSHLPLLPPATT
jgi:hypothetical protein